MIMNKLLMRFGTMNRDNCPIHVDHEALRLFSEETRLIAEQNRDMIATNHAQTVRMLDEASRTNSDGLENLRIAMEKSNKKFDTLNETVQRAGRVFSWWDSLPCKIRTVSKIISIVVAAMGGITVVITFFEKITGN